MSAHAGYAVKELFYTLQGEGAHCGRPAVFLRFTGCNLWSGREADRTKATCRFCDTDFVGTDGPGGGRFPSADALAEAAWTTWQPGALPSAASGAPRGRPYIVCTGGEPLLQLDEPLLAALHGRGFEVAIETNGTQPLPPGNERIDWICVSPKAGSSLILQAGDELKLVYPQPGAEPERFTDLSFRHFFLQPMDGPLREANTQGAIRYCLSHPGWRLSLQTHKLIGIP
jgi:7-carboxy-7-deazaguanine synthase (Cx14CxxC type)